MDEISEWAVKIAAAAAPDEIDLAPLMTTAYLRGGEDRAQLYVRREDSIVGGFGAGELTAVFPWILQGIVAGAPLLLSLLSSDTLKNAVAVVKDLLSIRDSVSRARKTATLPENPYTPLKRVITTLSTELEAAGMPQDECDLVTLRVLRTLLDDPAGAAEFVQTLSRTV